MLAGEMGACGAGAGHACPRSSARRRRAGHQVPRRRLPSPSRQQGSVRPTALRRTRHQDYYRQLLRLVYRLIFLFVAEDRGLLFDPKAAPAAHDCYMAFYSTARLRRLAERRRGTKHPDLFRTLRLVMEQLGHDRGCPELALPALGSFLWSADAIGDLGGAISRTWISSSPARPGLHP